jgi:hypothetical protein
MLVLGHKHTFRVLNRRPLYPQRDIGRAHGPHRAKSGHGYLVVTSAGRWIVVQTAEDRKAPHTDEDQSDAFKTMLAYSGKYRTEGNKISINMILLAMKHGTAPSRFDTTGLRVTVFILKWHHSPIQILVAR